MKYQPWKRVEIRLTFGWFKVNLRLRSWFLVDCCYIFNSFLNQISTLIFGWEIDLRQLGTLAPNSKVRYWCFWKYAHTHSQENSSSLIEHRYCNFKYWVLPLTKYLPNHVNKSPILLDQLECSIIISHVRLPWNLKKTFDTISLKVHVLYTGYVAESTRDLACNRDVELSYTYTQEDALTVN